MDMPHLRTSIKHTNVLLYYARTKMPKYYFILYVTNAIEDDNKKASKRNQSN